jgi:hypothetical protein
MLIKEVTICLHLDSKLDGHYNLERMRSCNEGKHEEIYSPQELTVVSVTSWGTKASWSS